MKLYAGLICILMGFSIQVNASQQTRLESWTFDPLVVSSSGNQEVSLRVQTDGSTSEVKLVLANGSVRLLEHQGNGLFLTTLFSAETLYGEWRKYVKRNYIGQLDLGGGEIYPLSINIDDGSIPEVTVLDLDETTRISPRTVNFYIPGNHPAQLSIEEVTRRFYQYFPDEFDFINVVTTATGSRDSYFINVKNSVLGLGLALFDNTSTYGSSGRLEGIVRIPNPMHFDLASLEYLRMLGYNWMNYSEHSKLSGAKPHWPISTLANGIMGYQDQSSSEYRWFSYKFTKPWPGPVPWNGDYYLEPLYSTPFYSNMEQYLMGLLPASRAGIYAILENQHQAVCFLCAVHGPIIPYDVNDLQSLHGSRVPDASESRKNFKIATIVVSGDRLLSPQEIRHFDYMAARGEATGELAYSRDDVTGVTNPFRTATRENGSLDALVTSDLVPNINEGLNDAWFDPDLPGQGIFVNVLPESKRMFVAWFTYETWRPEPRESKMGDAYHRWMTAIGEYSANRAELTLYRTIGGVFNSDMPAENIEIGKLVFKLKDCAHADLEYYVDSIFRQGQVSLRRIADDNVSWCEELQLGFAGMLLEKSANAPDSVAQANLAQVAMKTNEEGGVTDDAETFQITAGLNGAWYNPNWPGQGFLIDVLPDSQRVFVGWFTFDTERLYDAGPKNSMGGLNQRWLTALGEYHGNRANLELLLTSSGEFLWKNTPVTNQEYGVLELEFSDCETATAHFTIPDLAMEGTVPLKKISDENTAACKLLAGRPPTKNTISTIDDG